MKRKTAIISFGYDPQTITPEQVAGILRTHFNVKAVRVKSDVQGSIAYTALEAKLFAAMLAIRDDWNHGNPSAAIKRGLNLLPGKLREATSPYLGPVGQGSSNLPAEPSSHAIRTIMMSDYASRN